MSAYLNRPSRISGRSTPAILFPACDQIDYAERDDYMAVYMVGSRGETPCVSESKARPSRREPLDDHFVYSTTAEQTGIASTVGSLVLTPSKPSSGLVSVRSISCGSRIRYQPLVRKVREVGVARLDEISIYILGSLCLYPPQPVFSLLNFFSALSRSVLTSFSH